MEFVSLPHVFAWGFAVTKLNMDTNTLQKLIDQFDQETELDTKMRLANAMIDVIKKDIWRLTGEMRSQRPKPRKPKWAVLYKNIP